MYNVPDFTYEIKNTQGRNVISIIDLNYGAMSVTNGIEKVIEAIESKERINANDYMIIYKDSEDRWDGWDNRKEKFIGLGRFDETEAISAYIQKQLSPV